MTNALAFQLAALVLAALVIVALVRVYVAAVLPVWRNWRLARRGLSQEPTYQRERRGIVGLVFKALAALAVIAVLAAIAIPAYQGYSARALDKQRLAGIAVIQNALSAYYLDHSAYPISEAENIDGFGFVASLNDLVTGGYLETIPNDPGGEPATYVYETTPDGSYYCLGATVDGTPPPSTCDTARLGDTPVGANYLVGP